MQKDSVQIRLASGVSVERPLAKAHIEVEYRSCDQVVMVADEQAPNDVVFFNVPLEEVESRKLLLSAVKASNKILASAGHSSGTLDSQPSPSVDVGESLEVVGDDPEKRSGGVVTRGAKRKAEQAQSAVESSETEIAPRTPLAHSSVAQPAETDNVVGSRGEVWERSVLGAIFWS